MYKFKEQQIKQLRRSNLHESFIDRLIAVAKKITDKKIDKIAQNRNKEVAKFLRDLKKNPNRIRSAYEDSLGL
tara:strand:+ start:95 stop:313 length:219 start_codon:yes stop_codon:yes gene_type:complete